MKLSIILPTSNHGRTIRDVVTGIGNVPLDGLEREIVVVDDASTDGTREVLRELDRHRHVRVLYQDQPAGRGAAVARAFREAQGDVFVIDDASLDYDPRDYPALVGPILAGHADVVFGSRFLGSPRGHRVLRFRESVGSRLLTLLSNALTGLNLTDMAASCKALTRQVAARLDLRSDGPGVEPEITCKVGRLGVRVYEVPMPFQGQSAGGARNLRVADGLRMAGTLLRYATWDGPDGDVGVRTLRRMAKLEPYNRWLHNAFESSLGRRVLEVGAGVGNQTRYFLDRERVIASDLEPLYVDELREKIGSRPGVRVASFRFPLAEDDRDDLRREAIDTIVCLNVLEHIEDDRTTLRDFASLLPPGGRLVLLVPALPALYGTLDVHLHHYRRYERAGLQQRLLDAGFRTETLRYLNRLAVPGWWLNSRVLKRRVLPRGQLRLFRLLLPLLKFEERHPPSFGLSLLAICTKDGQPATATIAGRSTSSPIR